MDALIYGVIPIANSAPSLAQSIGITVSYARAGALSTDVFGPMTQAWVIGIFVCVLMITG